MKTDAPVATGGTTNENDGEIHVIDDRANHNGKPFCQKSMDFLRELIPDRQHSPQA